MAEAPIKIGMIGLDTSHVSKFIKLLNDPEQSYHVAGGKVVVAFPGGSSDFALSYNRVEGFTAEVRDEYGVRIVDSPQAVAEEADAILLLSVDGRVHLEQFRAIAPYGKPVYIDKPFVVKLSEGQEIVRLAEQYNVPLMSSSVLRYSEVLREKLSDNRLGDIVGVDTFGPMAMEPTQPGYFWYGIHAIELLFAAMGPGCIEVCARSTEQHECIVGLWQDGRLGTVRGNRTGNRNFGATLHRVKGSQFVDTRANPKSYSVSMLERVMKLFATGQLDFPIAETLHIVRFIEAANESRETGKSVRL